MVCAYQYKWVGSYSVVNYDRITVEFNNSNQPGGGDGSMNIETGVFTTITSGYYIVTFSGYVYARPGQWTVMYLYLNGIRVFESVFENLLTLGDSGDDLIKNQVSRTVIPH